jgi:hypothetical protein
VITAVDAVRPGLASQPFFSGVNRVNWPGIGKPQKIWPQGLDERLF